MKIVIGGGVAGGASAAARGRRLSEAAEIVVFERGPNLSFANCGLPYSLLQQGFNAVNLSGGYTTHLMSRQEP